jgi:hypothetical protein
MKLLLAALHSIPIRSLTMTPLRQRMLEDMAIRNLAANTQSAYIQQVIAYARYFHRAPEELGPEEIRAYQSRFSISCGKHGWFFVAATTHGVERWC